MEEQVQSLEVQNPIVEPALRHSTRNRVETKRLNIESFKGQSYENDGVCGAKCEKIPNSNDGPPFRRPMIWPPS